jgi:phage baseplate assembly protein W|tara:strand:- start:2039 stop:2488 length:450 start_codon:yes stop_codon:yes gene_type:complete
MAIRRAFAQEDTNLQTASVTTSRVRQYTDIDLAFIAKPTSGEIYKKTDAAAVRQAVKTLVMTNRLEKPFRPNFGGNVQGQLFELADRGRSDTLRRGIIENIEVYEPRAKVIDVRVNLQPDNNSLDATIMFKVVNTEEEVEFTTTLARLR